MQRTDLFIDIPHISKSESDFYAGKMQHRWRHHPRATPDKETKTNRY